MSSIPALRCYCKVRGGRCRCGGGGTSGGNCRGYFIVIQSNFNDVTHMWPFNIREDHQKRSTGWYSNSLGGITRSLVMTRTDSAPT